MTRVCCDRHAGSPRHGVFDEILLAGDVQPLKNIELHTHMKPAAGYDPFRLHQLLEDRADDWAADGDVRAEGFCWPKWSGVGQTYN